MATVAETQNHVPLHKENSKNLMLIWLDDAVNANLENFHAQKELRTIITNIQPFEVIDQCQDYIQCRLGHSKFILIVSEQFGQRLVPIIHEHSQIIAIYVLCANPVEALVWAKNFAKIRAITADITKLIWLVRQDHTNRINAEKMLLTISLLPTQALNNQDSSASNKIGKRILHGDMRFKDLINAGEFQYIDKNINDTATELAEKYNREFDQNISLLVFNAIQPVMYLLKREQSLSNFIESLKSTLNKHNDPPSLSQRQLIDALMINSNRSLRRQLTHLLSKRNPVPMIQPPIDKDYRFMSSVIHIWDYNRPILLSFGIGPCKGKTALVNALFDTEFEQSMKSIYFCETIDVDFGYHFIERRSVNIADTHGNMTMDTLKRINPLFTGYLIHVQANHLISHAMNVIEFLKLIAHASYILLLIRDTIDQEDKQLQSSISQIHETCSTCEVFYLPIVADKGNNENQEKINDLRNKIFQNAIKYPPSDEQQVRHQFERLMDSNERSNVERDKIFLDSIRPTLIHGKQDDYPLYSLFARLCETKLKIAEINPYNAEFQDEELYKLQGSLFETKTKLEKRQRDGFHATGRAFQEFYKLVENQENRLDYLSLLSSELKRERDNTMSQSKIEPFWERPSLEIHWRNAMIGFRNLNETQQENLIHAYHDFILEGNPFEIIDGDNFVIQHEFLSRVLSLFQKKKIFVISIIGPQNSGKSTLLNFLFGSLFEVRGQQHTRGVYGTLTKVPSDIGEDKLIPPDYDYILLIDTEGLMSTQGDDEQFDKRLILFCLAISHLVIVNVSGEINEVLNQMLVQCTESLKYLGETRITRPTVHFVLNQGTNPNKTYYEDQIQLIREYLHQNNIHDLIDIGEKNFHVLSTAFNRKPFLDPNGSCAALITNTQFVDDTRKLLKSLVDSCLKIIHETSDHFTVATKWIEFASDVLKTIIKYPDLTYFKTSFEREQLKRIREDIRLSLEQHFSPAQVQRLIDNKNERSANEINASFHVEYEKMLKTLEENLKKNLLERGVGGHICNQAIHFMKVQLKSRFRSLEVSTIMANQRMKLNEILDNNDVQFQEFASSTMIKELYFDRTSAINEFETMWNKRFKQTEAEFNAENQWTQSIDLVYRLHDALDQEDLPSLDNILTYIPLLVTVDQYDQTDFIQKCLSRIGNECAKRAFDMNPLTPQNTSEPNSVRYSHLRKPFTFLNIDELKRRLYDDKIDDNTTTRNFIKLATHPDFSQEIDKNWKSIVQILNTFHILIQRIEHALLSKLNDQSLTEMNLLQELLGIVNKLIQDINQEFHVFNFSISKGFSGMLHTCIVLSTALLYYYRQKTHFTNVLKSLNENKTKWQDRFIRMVVVEENDDENMATSLVNELVDVLHKSLNQQAKELVQKLVENEKSKFSQHSIIKMLDDEVYGASDDFLLHYVLEPFETIIQRFDENWKSFEALIKQQLNVIQSSHLEMIAEFFRLIEEMRSALKLKGADSLTFVEDLFQPINNTNQSNSIEKKMCMALLLYEYLSGENISTEVNLKRGSSYSVKSVWKQLRENMPIVSDQLKDLVRSMKTTFETYNITYLNLFLDKLINQKTRAESATCDLVNNAIEVLCSTTRQQLSVNSIDCRERCPCCKRLCDVDHRSDKTAPIGQDDNRHRCEFGHQIRGMGGIHYESTNEASVTWCEIIKDDDLIADNRGKRQSWLEYKTVHSDWDFGDPLLRETENPRYTYIWERIGEQLCRHYGNGMKFVTKNSPIPINHFILLLDHSGSMHKKGSFLKKVFHRRKSTCSPNDAQEVELSPWEHVLKAVKEFIDIRTQKRCHTDLMTVIAFGKQVNKMFHRERLSQIDVSQMNMSSSTGGKGTNICAAIDMLIETLHEVKNDSMSSTDRNTIILLTDGDFDAYPKNQLERLLNDYGSMINRFRTMGFGDYKKQALERINEKMHGQFTTIVEPDDIVEAYAEIADSCDTNES